MGKSYRGACVRPVPLLQRVKPDAAGTETVRDRSPGELRVQAPLLPLVRAQLNRRAGSATGRWQRGTELRGIWTNIIRPSAMGGRAHQAGPPQRRQTNWLAAGTMRLLAGRPRAARLRPARRYAYPQGHGPAEPRRRWREPGRNSSSTGRRNRPRDSTAGPIPTWAGPWWPGMRPPATNAFWTPWSRSMPSTRSPWDTCSSSLTSVSGCATSTRCWKPIRCSGDRRMLDRVRAALRRRKSQNAIARMARGQFLPGHAVCTYEQIRLPALFYPWRPASRDTCRPRSTPFAGSTRTTCCPYGVASGEEYFSGIGAFRMTETCDVAAGIWSMTLALSHLRASNRAATASSGRSSTPARRPIARDFKTMCYYQSPNRILGGLLPCRTAGVARHGCLCSHRSAIRTCLCCVGAVNRIVPSYVMHMWMATADRGLAATLYGPCTVSAIAGAACR